MDAGGILSTRFEKKGRGNPRLVAAKRTRFSEAPFEDAPVGPALKKPAILAETVQKIRREYGRLDRAALLLPDSWFRINLLDLPLAGEKSEPVDLIRWAVKKTLPISPEEMRFAWVPLQKGPQGTAVLCTGAVEATLSGIESAFRDAEVSVLMIEPVGINIWNAIAARLTTPAERLFFYFSDSEFTTGVFRGPNPVFLRSRNLSDVRSLRQEVMLSASYMKNRLEWTAPAESWVCGNSVDESVLEAIHGEFGAPIRTVELEEYMSDAETAPHWKSELTGASGVFTA